MPRKPPDYERLLTPVEVARMFNVNSVTVTRWANQGLLNVVFTPGGHRRFSETQVRDLLNGGPK